MIRKFLDRTSQNLVELKSPLSPTVAISDKDKVEVTHTQSVNNTPSGGLQTISDHNGLPMYHFQADMPHPSDPGYQQLIDDARSFAAKKSEEITLKKREHGNRFFYLSN